MSNTLSVPGTRKGAARRVYVVTATRITYGPGNGPRWERKKHNVLACNLLQARALLEDALPPPWVVTG